MAKSESASKSDYEEQLRWRAEEVVRQSLTRSPDYAKEIKRIKEEIRKLDKQVTIKF